MRASDDEPAIEAVLAEQRRRSRTRDRGGARRAAAAITNPRSRRCPSSRIEAVLAEQWRRARSQASAGMSRFADRGRNMSRFADRDRDHQRGRRAQLC
jgi:hypothetical protein